MDNQQLARAVERYFKAFGRKPDAGIIAAYAISLNRFSEEAILTALGSPQALEREHPLSAGRLAALARGGGITAEQRATKAFALLDRGLSVPANRSVAFADPIINATVRDLGGRGRLVKIPEAEFNTWIRKDFVEAYLTNLQVRPSPERCRPLAALENCDYLIAGVGRVGDLPPVVIGGQQAALANGSNAGQQAERLIEGPTRER